MEKEWKRRQREIFSKKFRQTRLERGYSVEQIAVVIGVSATAIRNYEAGKGIPQTIKLVVLANFYQVPMDYFFTS